MTTSLVPILIIFLFFGLPVVFGLALLLVGLGHPRSEARLVRKVRRLLHGSVHQRQALEDGRRAG